MGTTLTTNELIGRKVFESHGKKDKYRRIGKVRRFVFHPTEKRCIGFIVKRPDAALMFHRPDLFVALDSYEQMEDGLLISTDSKATGSAACKRLGVDWDRCVLWVGMQIITESGELLGRAGSVAFDSETGVVKHVVINEGATSKVLLGVQMVPASMIRGFKLGVGGALAERDGDLAKGSDELTDEELSELSGSIVVSDDVLDLEPEGGLAEKAGKASVIAVDKTKKAAVRAKDYAKETAAKAKPKMEEALESAKSKAEEEGKPTESGTAKATIAVTAAVDVAKSKTNELLESTGTKEYLDEAAAKAKPKVEEFKEKAKPKMEEAGKSTEEALNRGAFLVGRQVSKSKSMFGGFMDEYRKALNGDDEDDE